MQMWPSRRHWAPPPARRTQRDEQQRRRLRVLSDSVDLVLTILSCVLYVIETYVNTGQADSKTLWVFEVVISACLTAIFVFRIHSSSEPLALIFTPSSLLDFATSVPVLITMLLSPFAMHVVSVLRVLRVLRSFSFAADLNLRPATQQAAPSLNAQCSNTSPFPTPL